jgi:hypothetical protein
MCVFQMGNTLAEELDLLLASMLESELLFQANDTTMETLELVSVDIQGHSTVI